MYKVKLDRETIDAIRNYNDGHKYDDFTLTCGPENPGQNCISKAFVRNTKYVKVDINEEAFK